VKSSESDHDPGMCDALASDSIMQTLDSVYTLGDGTLGRDLKSSKTPVTRVLAPPFFCHLALGNVVP